MSNECPHGNGHQVQKVSSIVTGGTSTYQVSGPTGGLAFTGSGQVGTVAGYSTLSGYQQTALAQQLMPPAEPKKPHISGWVWAGVAFLGFMVYTLFTEQARETSFGYGNGAEGIWAYVLLFAIIAIVLLAAWNNEKETKAFGAYRPRWENAMIVWSRLYYCYRDDVVYDPQTGKAVPPSQMSSLL